jgi:membrane protein DedA with SNARE-associated domain
VNNKLETNYFLFLTLVVGVIMGMILGFLVAWFLQFSIIAHYNKECNTVLQLHPPTAKFGLRISLKTPLICRFILL